MAGEGAPYLIDQYRVKSTNDAWQIRTHEIPLRICKSILAKAEENSTENAEAARDGRNQGDSTPTGLRLSRHDH
jgi:hypothetical protein